MLGITWSRKAIPLTTHPCPPLEGKGAEGGNCCKALFRKVQGSRFKVRDRPMMNFS
jgi:hypothetical protein